MEKQTERSERSQSTVEEVTGMKSETVVSTVPLVKENTPPRLVAEVSTTAAPEFLWLFEYGLDMDVSALNSTRRLHGAALVYGPAVLKGYQLVLGLVEGHTWHIVATIVSATAPEAEVWGILYRVPRRVIESHEDTPSLLDRVHTPEHFEPIEVVVHETLRQRDITCVAYIASHNVQQFRRLATEADVLATSYMRRLVECAKQQKLPQHYLQALALCTTRKAKTPLPNASVLVEQDTEPLPVVSTTTEVGKATHSLVREVATAEATQLVQASTFASRHPGRWLMSFALYLVLLLLLTLILSVVQVSGPGNGVTAVTFAPLGVPWFVLIYGLIGGCISSMLALGRYRGTVIEDEFAAQKSSQQRYLPGLPGFVVLTWFMRPYIGAILAALAYLALNSGFLTLSVDSEQHYALSSLMGALAGLCEGWIFFRRR